MPPDGPSRGSSSRANPARGLALIATALILGIFVLRQGFDTDNDSAAEAAQTGDTEQQEESSGDGAQGEGDEQGGDGGSDQGGDGGGAGNEPQDEPLPASELAVRVANTTSVTGAAAGWSENIGTNGYEVGEPVQAAGEERPASAVYFRAQFEREADQLAEAIGVAPDAVAPLPDPPPVSIEDEPLLPEGAQLLVILGTDLASQI